MPVQSLLPIRHGRQPGGLLASGVMRPLATDGKDWTGGVSFFQSCDVTGGVHTCDAEAEDKIETEYGELIEFDPILLYNLQRCLGFVGSGIESVSVDNFARVQQRLLAHEIHSGAVSGNPSFESEATDKTEAVLSGLKETLTVLVNALCEFSISEVIIHAPIHSMPVFLANNLVVWDSTGQRYMLGHVPVVFDCYPNVGPENPSVESGLGPFDVAETGEVWLYATGPIEFQLGTEFDAASFDQKINEHQDLRERMAIYRFDGCSVLSAKAVLCPASVEEEV